MPKRKGGRKKKGGKSNPLANPGNVHNPKNFGSNQGLVSGCSGCDKSGMFKLVHNVILIHIPQHKNQQTLEPINLWLDLLDRLVKYQANLILIPCTVAETQVNLFFFTM